MNPTNDFDSYLPVYQDIPSDWESARQFLLERLREINETLNIKDYGLYIDRDTLNCQAWLPGADGVEYRDVIRHVVDIGALPNFAVVNPLVVAHGIVFSENTSITRLYGTATDPDATTITSGIPLPFVEMVGGAHIGLEITNTDIIITGDGATDYSAYTRSFVVVEWIDEV